MTHIIGPKYVNCITFNNQRCLHLFGDIHIPPEKVRRTSDSIFITNHIDNLISNSKYPVDLYLENNASSIEGIFYDANVHSIPNNLLYPKIDIQKQISAGTLNMPPLPATCMFFITNAIKAGVPRHSLDKLRVHYFSTITDKTEADASLIIRTSGDFGKALDVIKNDAITHTSDQYILSRISEIYEFIRTYDNALNEGFVRMIYYMVRNTFVNADICKRILDSIGANRNVIIYAGLTHIDSIERTIHDHKSQ